MTITDLLGGNDAAWMADPSRKCDTSAFDHPKELGYAADDWFRAGTTENTAALLCSGCPVATQCLQYALDNPEVEGVWGGTIHKQRLKALGKKPRPTPIERPIVTRDICGTNAGYSQHRQSHEAVCEPCRKAFNAYRRAWRNGKKVVA